MKFRVSTLQGVLISALMFAASAYAIGIGLSLENKAALAAFVGGGGLLMAYTFFNILGNILYHISQRQRKALVAKQRAAINDFLDKMKADTRRAVFEQYRKDHPGASDEECENHWDTLNMSFIQHYPGNIQKPM